MEPSLALLDTDACRQPILPTAEVAVEELKNGLSLLVLPDRSAPVVSIEYWVATGSIHEGRWLGSGLSHLVEHLMFKGTDRRGPAQMASQMQDLGGHLNAYTSFDRTVYYVDLPAENWRPALDILSDAVLHSTLPEEEFEREKEVIRREFAMGDDNPNSRLVKKLFRTVFTTHPYRFPVIGLRDLFDQRTREDAYSYYRERYSLRNLTLVVAGPVDPTEVREAVLEFTGRSHAAPLPDIFLPPEPPQLAPRQATTPFPTALNRTAIAFPQPSVHDEDAAALELLAVILGTGRSSRLYRRLVEEEGLAESSTTYSFAGTCGGLWAVWAQHAPERREAVTTAIREEIERVRQAAPSSEEIQRAKRLSLLSELHQLKKMSGKAALVGRGWMLARDPHFAHRHLERLQAVDAAQLLSVAQRHLLRHRESRVELVSAQSHSPAVHLSGTALSEPPQPYLLEPCPGLRVLHLPGEGLPLLTLRATLGVGGLLTEGQGKAGLNHLAARLLAKGTVHRDATRLAADVEQLGAQLSADSGNNSTTVALELLADDWRAGTEIFLEVLRQPLLREHSFATEKRKQLSALAEEADHPMAQARNLVRAALYPGHPYSTPPNGTREALELLTEADVNAHWAARFHGPGVVLSVAGPLPLEEWSAWVGRELGSFAGVAQAPALPLPVAPTAPVHLHATVPKEQCVLQIAYPTGPLREDEQLIRNVLDEALSDMASPLFLAIRERMGLAYFVGASQFIGLAAGYFCVYVGTDPRKRAAVEAALLAEIARVAEEGLTPEQVERARRKLLSREQIEAQSAASLVYASSLDTLYGMGYDYAVERRQRLRTLTVAEVNACARRLFTQPGYLVASISPD